MNIKVVGTSSKFVVYENLRYTTRFKLTIECFSGDQHLRLFYL